MKKRLILISKKKLILISIITRLILSAMIIAGAIAAGSPLQGRIIVLDPGHGGVDSGASNKYIKEKDINLDVALRLQKLLEHDGSVVYMTRTEDVDLSNSPRFDRERYLEDLNTRLNIINNSDAQIFISIHTNINPGKPSTRGAIVLYSSYHPHNMEMAYMLQNIFNTLQFTYNGRSYKSSHTPQKGQYYLLVNSSKPGVIVETGFISNSTDLSLLLKPEYRDYIARSIYQGLADYFDICDNLEARNNNLIEPPRESLEHNEVIFTVP